MALLLLLAGCGGAADPCASVTGSCLGLTVQSTSISHVDTLLIAAFGQVGTSKAKLSSLPIRVALLPPAGTEGTTDLAVQALSGGAIVGSGSGGAIITPGRHTSVTISLTSGGALTIGDDMAEPVAGDDLSSEPTADMTQPSSPTGCSAGKLLCTASGGASICIDIASDFDNCGGCNVHCKLGQLCHNAVCQEQTVDCGSEGATCKLSTCSKGDLSMTPNRDVIVDPANGRRLWARARQMPTYYSQAASVCSHVSLDGVTSGWRLPTFAELGSTLRSPGGLQGCGQCNPAIDQGAFPDLPENELEWTTTPGHGDGYVYLVDYCGGRSTYGADTTSKSENYPYRCTHDPLPDPAP